MFEHAIKDNQNDKKKVLGSCIDCYIKDSVTESSLDLKENTKYLTTLMNLTNSMAYGTRRFNAAFTRALQ